LVFSTRAGASIAERMRVQHDGNVGIGTATPEAKLDIKTASSAWNVGASFNDSVVRISGEDDGTNQGGLGLSYTNSGGAIIGSIQHGNDYKAITLSGRTFKFEYGSSTPRFFIDSAGKVGIGTVGPAEKLDVVGTARVGYSSSNGHLIGSKAYTITNNFTTGLTVTLNNHTACHVKVFITGDWANHSSLAYVGEFIIQNSENGYNEPGIILTQQDNLPTDSVTAKIVDPNVTSQGQAFTIQFQAVSGSNVSESARLCYHIMGDALSVT